MTELQIMVNGWKARDAMDAHANANGEAGLIAPRQGACLPCREAAVAWLRGASVEHLETMYCAEVQAWRAQIRAANEIALSWGDR